ncbi:hypothetical protein G7Y89_g7836 [Cudoniella acicularis]|uniref:AAA+ ATPase domain-containing protein n=1 Tax=Cudoniella acicularis TaxID=354080 RepID=A0A8H4RJA8_9HELO|nr:hypothetical protein G7Y89_g7836 [Cudoniella acicularis]
MLVPKSTWSDEYWNIKYSGHEFDYNSTSFTIPKYCDNMLINNLDVYPIGCHEDTKLPAVLNERGKRVLQFQHTYYQSYTGIAYTMDSKRFNVTGRVVIDTFLASRENTFVEFSVTKLEIAEEKKWMSFDIDNVYDVQWNAEDFDHLVYPEAKEDLLLTFVENHQTTGQGLVLLLSGPPGTGKKLSAEAIADKAKRPFYHLEVEELAIDPSSLGENLSKVLNIATEWDAVVILDAFLPQLEYFRGILFLTTNLLDDIDDAFRSRVHIHILFSSLTFESRLSIWRKFLSRVQSPALVVDAESPPTGGKDVRLHVTLSSKEEKELAL